LRITVNGGTAISQISSTTKKILICVLRMNESLTGLDWKDMRVSN